MSAEDHLSFQRDIAGFFTPADIEHMKMQTGGNLDLGNYERVKEWASRIYDVVEDGSMPLGEPQWSDERITTFKSWIEQGCPP